MPDSLLYFRASILVCWREGGKRGQNHLPSLILPSQKLKSQTTGKSFLDPAFQIGLCPDSFKLLLACLHLNSLHASWVCSPLFSNSSHMKPAPRVTRRLLIPKQPESFRGLTWLALKRPLLPQISTVSPPLILAVYYVFSVLPFSLYFSLNIKATQSFWSWLLKCFPLSWQSYPSAENLTTCSVKNTQAPCSSQVSFSKSRLLLLMNYCTSPPNFKIIELKVVEKGLEIS